MSAVTLPRYFRGILHLDFPQDHRVEMNYPLLQNNPLILNSSVDIEKRKVVTGRSERVEEGGACIKSGAFPFNL